MVCLGRLNFWMMGQNQKNGFICIMKINDAIRGLWRNGFFLKHRKSDEVKDKLFEEYQITCSNVLMQLKSCKKFLRIEDKGWIQRKNADFYEGKKPKIDYFKLLNIRPE